MADTVLQIGRRPLTPRRSDPPKYGVPMPVLTQLAADAHPVR